MKTIEELAYEAYQGNEELPDKYKTQDSMWMDWFKKGYNACTHENRWRKVSEELPEVREEHYWILTKSDDGRLDVVSILNGYDKDIVKFLLKNHVEWKPID